MPQKRTYYHDDYRHGYQISAAERAERVRKAQAHLAADRVMGTKTPPPPSTEEKMYPKMKQAMTRDKVSREASYRQTTGPRRVAEMTDAENWEELRKRGWRLATDQDVRNLNAYPSMEAHYAVSTDYAGRTIVRPSTEAERQTGHVEEEISPNG